MRFRESAGIVFLVLGIFIAILSIPSSAAISSEVLDRDVTAYIADDNSSELMLEGFDGCSYNINNKFKDFGKIINNTNHTLVCSITINVDFNTIPNKNCKLGFRVSEQEGYAINNGSNILSLDLILLPKQTYDFEALLDRNQNSPVYVTFDIRAQATDGSYSIDLADSPEAPRRVTFY